MLVRVLLALATVAYPFAFLALLKTYGITAAVVLLLALALARFALNPDRIWGTLLALTVLLVLLSRYFDNETALLFYPVLMNAAMLFIFAASLAAKRPIIEAFARLKNPNLPPEGVVYTRRLTYVWCGFFIVNGTIATATCLMDNLSIWALYNGLISYILMGVLFSLEYLYRRFVAKV